jgi:peptide deformylase
MKITQFGNPFLRVKTKPLSKSQVLNTKTKKLINEMQGLLLDKKLGIGLASTQVGKSFAIAVIELQKTKVRPDIERLSLVIINP